MRKFLIILGFSFLIGAPLAAQPRINMDFPGLEERAVEVVDVTLDGALLKLAAKFLRAADEGERAISEMVQGLEGIYVRSYEFAKEGEYDRTLIDRVKSQLGPTWKPLVTVRSKTKENVNIYADLRGEKIVGLVIVAAEPREFTVVNIVGPIDIEKLAELEGEFGIPRISKEKDRD
ncbi:MAG TPA: DUF4252 domain-containing protein [Thermoanaerobaculia bacterium]|nr:DUF4252 domain-containing protein [Thermoanaerobaculia bacterium]